MHKVETSENTTESHYAKPRMGELKSEEDEGVIQITWSKDI